MLAIAPRGDQGETTNAGTRNPRKPSLPKAASAAGMGAPMGGTCSKKPPHSSKLITSAVLGQFGLEVTA